MKTNIGFLLLYFLFVLTINYAQSTNGNIQGWLVDEANNPVISAYIQVDSPDLHGFRGAQSNEQGYFQITALPIGEYSVKINHVSFQIHNVRKIIVLLGQTTGLGVIKLKQRSIETEEVVIVSDKQAIDTRSATRGKNLSTERIYSLPVERDYIHAAGLLPHANLSYKNDGGTNFAGATGAENKYFLDGADISDPCLGIEQFNFPYNFIREMEIRTGGYQAEYESSLGGIINSITNSGSNEIHGTIFGFFTNNNFSRDPRRATGEPPKGSFSNYDIGFGFGGSIIRDKLWYYGTYDPQSTIEDIPVTGLAMQNSNSTQHKFAGKLAWNFNQSTFLTLSAFGNLAKGREIITTRLTVKTADYCNYDFTNSQVGSIINGVYVGSKDFILQSSLFFIRRKSTKEPISELGREPYFKDFITGIASGGYNSTSDNRTHQLGLAFKGSINITNHLVKAGFEYQLNSISLNETSKGIERRPDPITDTGDVYYTWDIGGNASTVKQLNLSAFIQDSWQITRRLCLNAGVRWNPQWSIASDGTIGQKILSQIQPRFGIIYQIREPGTQKITASFGRYYQPLLLSLATAYHIKNGKYLSGTFPNDPRIDTSGGYTYNLSPFVTNIPDVKGQYFDEITIGYERLLFSGFRLGISGIFRWLGKGIEDGVVSEQDQEKYGSLQLYGNPGYGSLSMFPKMKREYTALELTFERLTSDKFNFFVSYVLSRNQGNYDGFAESYGIPGASSIIPNNSNQFSTVDMMNNSFGLLPNDRTHILKCFSSYAFDFGLSIGIVFQWMSGTPLNELGADSNGLSIFIKKRGTAGRTPSIRDINFRLTYDISKLIPVGISTKLIADLLHVASQRTALDFDQLHYWNYDKTVTNSHYLVPVQFQPPMSVRVGFQADF